AVHTRLLPGRVVDTRMRGRQDSRSPDRGQVRELILDVDDKARRLAYAVVDRARMPIACHHASFHVFPATATAAGSFDRAVPTHRSANELAYAFNHEWWRAGDT